MHAEIPVERDWELPIGETMWREELEERGESVNPVARLEQARPIGKYGPLSGTA